jgi:hypothetical protein
MYNRRQDRCTLRAYDCDGYVQRSLKGWRLRGKPFDVRYEEKIVCWKGGEKLAVPESHLYTVPGYALSSERSRNLACMDIQTPSTACS